MSMTESTETLTLYQMSVMTLCTAALLTLGFRKCAAGLFAPHRPHRAGGRCGNSDRLLGSDEERGYLSDIEKLTRRSIPVIPTPVPASGGRPERRIEEPRQGNRFAQPHPRSAARVECGDGLHPAFLERVSGSQSRGRPAARQVPPRGAEHAAPHLPFELSVPGFAWMPGPIQTSDPVSTLPEAGVRLQPSR
jgi:hypothetical protein